MVRDRARARPRVRARVRARVRVKLGLLSARYSEVLSSKFNRLYNPFSCKSA